MPLLFTKGSFVSGELSPLLYARVDLEKYHTGAKKLTNFLVHPQGGVSNRAGTRYIAKTKYQDREVRLIPFVFSREQTYMLEFGPGYIRFISGFGQLTVAGVPYEVETEYAEEDLKYLRTVQSADTLFVFCRDRPPKRLVRYGNTSWSFEDFPFKLGPFLTERDSEAKVMVALDASGSATPGNQTYVVPGNYIFTVPAAVTAIDLTIQGGSGTGITQVATQAGNTVFGTFIAPGVSDSVAPRQAFSQVSVEPGTQISITVGQGATGTAASGAAVSGAAGVVIISWSSSMANQTYGTMHANDDLFKPEHVGALWKIRQNVAGESVSHPSSNPLMCYTEWYLETSGYWAGTLYVQRYDEANGSWENIRTLTSSKDKNYSITGEVDEPVQIRLVSSGYVAEVPAGTTADDYLLGKAILQTTPTVYDGVVKITQYLNAKQVRVAIQKDIAVPNSWTGLWYEGAWSEAQGYPSCVGFYQDRLCAGGTAEDPFMLFFSQPGDYINFETSLPVEDDDAISARILARQNGRIREIIPAGDLLVLTDVGEFKVSASDQGAISPANINVSPQSNRGCDIVSPVQIGNQLIFAQAGGSIVRDFGYTLEVDGYSGNDLTVLASHLLQDYSLLDMAYQAVPDSIVWCVREDGVLLGLTYLREQDVFAWHRHLTRGVFKAVEVLPASGGEDDVYFVVERENGRFIEYMTNRLPKKQAVFDAAEFEETFAVSKCFFVDSGLVYEGKPAKTIYGLEHLAGLEVAILADGCLLPPQKVKTLERQGEEVWGIELAHPASYVIVGLPYTATLETLKLELSQEGQMQGRQKAIPEVILRVHNSIAASVGVDGQELTPLKWNELGEPLDTKPYLFSGDKAVKPFSGYQQDGCLKIVQDKPLPLTVLGIIPQVEAGG